MLAAFIGGLAAGGLWIRRRIDGIDDPMQFLARILLAISALAALTIAGYYYTFDVIAWDAPGAGSSSDPPDPFTIADWSRSLAKFLDSFKLVGEPPPVSVSKDEESRHPGRAGAPRPRGARPAVARTATTGPDADACSARLDARRGRAPRRAGGGFRAAVILAAVIFAPL